MPRSPDAASILTRQAARESSARTYARSMPIVPVRASGMTVEGADGHVYLDCLAGAGVFALGHNHPAVVEALTALLERGMALQTLDIATVEKDAFVEELFATLPGEVAERGRIHFCGPTGADAVEAAMKLTQWATGRQGFLTFTGGYHGMTTGALALTGNVAARQRVAGVAADVTRLPFPYPYRCPFGVGGEATQQLSATYVERLLDDVNGGVPPAAAMILEAVQGEGGVIPAPDAWLREMRRITDERRIPLIVDEVQSGLGRTGAMWAVDHSGIVPDVMVLSKAIGGGMPMAVIVYREELDGWDAGAHTGTFRGNQLAMVAGAATFRVVRQEGLVARAAEVGERLLRGLRELQSSHGSIGEVRGRGLMIGMELVDADAGPDRCGARPADPALALRLRRACLERGLLVELGGRDDAVLRLLPPLVITDVEATTVLERLADALASVSAARPARAGASVASEALLSGGVAGAAALRPLVDVALEALALGAADRGGPLPSGGPKAAETLVLGALGDGVLPDDGVGSVEALGVLARALAAGAADPADASCAAHLHCPPLAVAVAADLVVSALNPSLDSWDQAPSAVVVETEVLAALAGLIGWDRGAGGTITTGGTESNLVGMLLGREHLAERLGIDATEDGVTPGVIGVFGSEVAHFSLARSAGVLGIGERFVRGVAVDAQWRMRVDALEAALVAHDGPAIVVATAGTTDFGSIDPMREVGEVARRHGAWFHVDAAYGAGALCSDRLRPLLDGIDTADSVALDLHKLGWQPVAAGAVVVRDVELLTPLERRVAYLNPSDDEAAGLTSLLGHSLRTTRRSDAFKMAVTMRALGRKGLGRLVDRCHDLALYAASLVEAHDRLALESPPVLTTVVFRYTAAPDHLLDEVNAELRRRLLHDGTAVIGRTEVRVNGALSTRVKLTLLNPTAREVDIAALLDLVVAAGDHEARIRKQG